VGYFEQRLGQHLPDDVHRYAADIGFADPAAFQRAVLREYQFVLAAEQKDSQD
jgi:AraC-like DNA-binding protein